MLSKREVNDITVADIFARTQELLVHQVELEMQNEELKRARQELEESRNKYLELYEFSPIGYFTLDKQVRLKDELFHSKGHVARASIDYLSNQWFLLFSFV